MLIAGGIALNIDCTLYLDVSEIDNGRVAWNYGYGWEAGGYAGKNMDAAREKRGSDPGQCPPDNTKTIKKKAGSREPVFFVASPPLISRLRRSSAFRAGI